MSKNYIILLSFTLLTQVLTEKKLIFVWEHVRHGARGYCFPSSTTKYIDQYGTDWGSNGELTQVGQRQHYILGVRNRQRYSSLLDFNKYDPQQIKIKSTNVNRVLESIYSQLLGMYKPGSGGSLTDEQLKWSFPPGEKFLSPEVKEEVDKLSHDTLINKHTPVPVYTYETIRYKPSNCPHIKAHMEKSWGDAQRDIVLPFLKEFDAKFGDQLMKYFKQTSKDFIYKDFGGLNDKLDNFVANIENGKKLEDFFEQTKINVDEFLPYCHKIKEFHLYHRYCDMKTCTMEGTHYMRDVLKYMKNRVRHESSIDYDYPKMVIQGGHDDTVNTLQYFMKNAFGIQEHDVKFASHVFFELYRDTVTDQYTVTYICDLEEKLSIDYFEFIQKVENTMFSDKEINDFCHERTEEELKEIEIKTKKENLYFYIIIGMALVAFALIILTIVFGILYKSSKNEKIINRVNLLSVSQTI